LLQKVNRQLLIGAREPTPLVLTNQLEINLMNTITVSRAKHINLTYSTQGKHTATWKDYSEKTVRRTIQLDQWHDTDVAALEAAQLFVDWCNSSLQKRDAGYINKLGTVTLSYIDADRHAVAVTMYAEKISTEVAA
tara:strand:- start:257 stop:664 length:408 start_codon:yes stop_codon:yes gene_type:complete